MRERSALILAKNAAFHALVQAERHIDRRRHSHRRGKGGPVPAEWLARRAELAEAYEHAKRQAREQVEV